MAKIKEVSSYNGTSWDTPVPIGANDANVDITASTTNPTDTTATSAGLVDSNVTVSSGDTDASAWTKFNRFRKRVQNAFGNFAGVTLRTAYNTSNTSTSVYTTGVINNYMSNVIGYTGTTAPSAGTVAAQLSSLNSSVSDLGISISDINELLASIEDGDTATRDYNYREFVLWKGDLYVTSTSITSGTAFSTSNLIAIPNGGFNEIQSRIGNLFASYTGFDSLSDLVSYLVDERFTGEYVIAKITGTLSPAFYGSTTTRPSIAIINKASSNNAYYLAFTADRIAVGNINLTSGTISLLKNLAITDESLQLNSSISYPAYLTCGVWRTGNDGTINLNFPCTSLKKSSSYTSTSTISVNMFEPGSTGQAKQVLDKAINGIERVTTDCIVLQLAAVEGFTGSRMGFFSTRTGMTITAS